MDTSFDIEPLIHGSMKKKLDIILTAPGINNPVTAIGIISEIGVNMEAFPSAKHFHYWLVLPQPIMKVQGRKNLSEFPKPDAILNLC